MTATPLLDNSIAGRYTKEITDGWFLDKKDSQCVLDLLHAMEEEVRESERQAVYGDGEQG